MPSGALRWSAYEHEHVERGSDWYWALGIAAASLSVISILFANFLFAVLIILAAFTIALSARTPPERVEFEISEKGIRTGNVLHRYDEVISFWVDDEKAEPVLLVDTVKFMSPNLIIPLANVDPGDIRNYLREFAEEKRMKEPVYHKILEFFGL